MRELLANSENQRPSGTEKEASKIDCFYRMHETSQFNNLQVRFR